MALTGSILAVIWRYIPVGDEGEAKAQHICYLLTALYTDVYVPHGFAFWEGKQQRQLMHMD
jgi:hypothetical protein